MKIEFGPDTNYGRETWAQRAPEHGGEVQILVAGMRSNTLYHMRAKVALGDDFIFADEDHPFTTGDIPMGRLPNLAAQTMPGMNPQSGIELVDLATNTLPNGSNEEIEAVVTDLDGNVIWFYDAQLPVTKRALNPIKPLPNGHFLLGFEELPPGGADGQNSLIQEVDFTGKVVWQMSYPDLNDALATATCAGCNITVIGTHHDFAVLTNGPLIVLASEDRFFPSLDGYPNGTHVVGDVVVDLGESRRPTWIWSTFDHWDPNRHLIGLPDWTHANSIVYSPHDHNLLSIRHQSWVIKIDYRDGRGTGDILWKLGYQGDSTLLNGKSPVDWQYAQHDFNLIGPTHEGVFEAEVFDNGTLRVLNTNGTVCGSAISYYSRSVNFRIDERERTAALTWVDTLSNFSFFGSSIRRLPKGNVEIDQSAGPAPGPNAVVFEVTRTSPPQTVWQLQVKDQYAYRAFSTCAMVKSILFCDFGRAVETLLPYARSKKSRCCGLEMTCADFHAGTSFQTAAQQIEQPLWVNGRTRWIGKAGRPDKGLLRLGGFGPDNVISLDDGRHAHAGVAILNPGLDTENLS